MSKIHKITSLFCDLTDMGLAVVCLLTVDRQAEITWVASYSLYTHCL